MPNYQIKAPNGQTYKIEGPEGASDEQVRAEVLRQHPEAGSTEKPEQLGPANFPPGWVVDMPGLPPHPQGSSWSSPLAKATMGGIAAAGVPAVAPMLGAGALTSQLLGGAAAGLGASPEHPIQGMALGALFEGALGMAGKAVGSTLGRRAGAFEWAQKGIDEAAAAIRDRVPKALKFFEIPALSKTPMTFDEAIAALKKARGQDFEEGKAEFVRELNKLELPGAMQRGLAAGESFAKRTTDYLRDPGSFSSLAHNLAQNPETAVALGVPALGLPMLAGKAAGAPIAGWVKNLVREILP